MWIIFLGNAHYKHILLPLPPSIKIQSFSFLFFPGESKIFPNFLWISDDDWKFSNLLPFTSESTWSFWMESCSRRFQELQGSLAVSWAECMEM